MAKRFTDTNKWDSSWFHDLKPNIKIFWIYLQDKCDMAGVWEVNFKKANQEIGTRIKEEDAYAALSEYIVALDHRRWMIKNFIQFQNGLKLNTKNNAHKGVVKCIKYHNLQNSPLLGAIELQETKETSVTSPYGSGSGSGNGRGSGKEPSKKEIHNTYLERLTPHQISNPRITPDHLVDLYNQHLAGVGRLKRCVGLGPESLKQAVMAFSRLPDANAWVELFEAVKSNPVLTGKTRTVFLATLDWLVVEENALKVLNGKYDIPSQEELEAEKIDPLDALFSSVKFEVHHDA